MTGINSPTSPNPSPLLAASITEKHVKSGDNYESDGSVTSVQPSSGSDDRDSSGRSQVESGVPSETSPPVDGEPRASDFATMATKYIDVPPDVAAKQSLDYTWEIPDWQALPARVLSNVFECGGQRWQLLLYPEGNPVNKSRGHVALYLKALPPSPKSSSKGSATPNSDGGAKTRQDEDAVMEDAAVPETDAGGVDDDGKWACCATFAISIWNPQYPEVFVVQSARNRFTPTVCDWGYGEFTPLREAFVKVPASASAPLIDVRNGAVNITCHLMVLDDPTGVLWHDFVDYNSRQETGFTGLMNQGATCYLNSLLQSLYFTKVFRKAVYDIPDSGGVVGGLQRLFYLLSKSPDSVSTLPLTKSFGWDTADAFTQHDVQELNRVLMDRLETKMKGTRVDGELSNIFVGQMKSFIKCINVDFESSRVEDFWDIQLNVKGMRNVEDSFRDYVATEVLEGDNQYQATGFGLQDAKKGVIFKSFPPVLHLQLKRYDYDWMRDIEVKINDRYEFPLDLNLADYIEADTPEASEDWTYELHGVLVHSGDLNAGHYYALIKPTADGSWHKFDDDRVTKATLREVLDDNFGGDEGSTIRRVTSAYMLVYIRKAKLDFVLPKASDAPPAEIAEQIAIESRIEDEKRRQRAEQQQYINLRLLTPRSFSHHRGVGTMPWVTAEADELEQPTLFKARREAKISSLRRELGGDDTSFWLVPYARYHRGSARLQMLRDQHEQHPIEQLSQWTESSSPCLFVENSRGDPDTEVFLFVKIYDPTKAELKGASTVWAPLKSTLLDALHLENGGLVGAWLERPGPPFAPLVPLDVTATLADLRLEPADAVVIQTVQSGADEVTADVYYNDLLHSVTVWLKAKDATDGAAAQVIVNTKGGYEALARAAGKALDVDPAKLQLWATEYGWRPSFALASDGSNVDQLWATGGYDPALSVLYRVLDRSLDEFETMKELDVTIVRDGMQTLETTKVLVPAAARIADALAKASADNATRLWSVMYSGTAMRKRAVELSKLDRVADVEEELLEDGIFAGELGADEVAARETAGAKLVEVFHFEKDTWRAYGLPFTMALVPGDTVATVRSRLHKTLGLSEKTVDKIRFAACSINTRPRYLEDDADVYAMFAEGDSFGLDHMDTTRQSTHQASIVIR